MKKRTETILILILIFFTTLATFGADPIADASKNGKIKGVVVDQSTGNPMEYANIALYNKSDSALVTGSITNLKGEFEIKGIAPGEYYLEAHFIGFEKTRVPEIKISSDVKLFDSGNIKLAPHTREIGGVEVVASKAAIEYKLDKKVVNVSQVISAAGGTAVDVLENTPSVQVDIEGNVSLRGSSNFTVLIDGRPSVLKGTDALRQIPASALENIEIITNPSAKYDPDGMAGIINLVMKKNVLGGLNGIVNASAGTGDKYKGDFTLNYRTKKYNLFGGLDWRDETNLGTMKSTRETYRNDSTFFLTLDGKRNFVRGGNTAKAGMDLFLSKKSTLSLSGEYGKSKNNAVGGGKIRNYSAPAKNDQYSVSENLMTNENDMYSATLNFQHRFNDKGHRIEAMAFYSSSSGESKTTEDETITNNSWIETNQFVSRISSVQNEKLNSTRMKLDYTNPFNKTSRLEAGFQARLESQNQSFSFQDFDLIKNLWASNPLFSSTTDYQNDIYAVYFTLSSKIGKLDYMAGLRGELNIRDIQNSNLSKNAELNRFDIFPSLHVSYKPKETSEWMASYSRRVNRPMGRELDPTPGYMSRYTIWYGNPNLKPEFTDSYETGFMQRFGKSFASLDLFHRITHNKIDRIQTPEENGIISMRPENFDRDFSTGIELTTNINATKWLLLNGTLSTYYYRITGVLDNVEFNRKSSNVDGRLNATAKISADGRLQLTGFYRGPSVSAQGNSSAMLFTNVSYRHEFMKKKLAATLSLQDIFGTARFERESFGDTFKSWFRMQREPRVFMLTLSYKINNFKTENRENQSGGNRGEGMDFGIGM